MITASDHDSPDLPEEPPNPTHDDEWDEPDPTRFDDDAFLNFCEIDDAPEPDPRDYWDDSLDGEWDCAPASQGWLSAISYRPSARRSYIVRLADG